MKRFLICAFFLVLWLPSTTASAMAFEYCYLAPMGASIDTLPACDTGIVIDPNDLLRIPPKVREECYQFSGVFSHADGKLYCIISRPTREVLASLIKAVENGKKIRRTTRAARAPEGYPSSCISPAGVPYGCPILKPIEDHNSSRSN